MQTIETQTKKTINEIEIEIKKLKKYINFLKTLPIKSGEKTRRTCIRNLEVQLIKAEYQVFLLKTQAKV